jgi:hypothetical protein
MACPKEMGVERGIESPGGRPLRDVDAMTTLLTGWEFDEGID